MVFAQPNKGRGQEPANGRSGFANRSLSDGKPSPFSLENGDPLNRLYAVNLLLRKEPLFLHSKRSEVGNAVLNGLWKDRQNSLALYGEVIMDVAALMDNTVWFHTILGELELALKDNDKGVRQNAWTTVTGIYEKRGVLEAAALDALLGTIERATGHQDKAVRDEASFLLIRE